MKKLSFLVLLAFVCFAQCAYAHVVVFPKVAAAESYQTFSVSVPAERAVPTVGLKLIVPEGASSVRPTVKPGWTITLKKEMREGVEVVTEIAWAGGSVPAGFRDDFGFSVKTPASGPMVWKAYQTYADGKTVTWDAAPAEGGHDHESVEGPYSTTELTAASGHDDHDGAEMEHEEHGVAHELFVPMMTLAIAFLALMVALDKRKQA